MTITQVPVDESTEHRIDELASLCEVPVRTIREYQRMGLVPPPTRQGRVGIYGHEHVARLRLIARLQARGYSLAGIADLVDAWGRGTDIADVLGLDLGATIPVDEVGAPADIDQLRELLPGLVPDRLGDVIEAGIVEECGPEQYCVPSPSLLRLVAELIGLGFDPEAVLATMHAVTSAATAAATAVAEMLRAIPAAADPQEFDALVLRGRGLLAQGTGRAVLHALGRELGIDDEDQSTRIRESLEL